MFRSLRRLRLPASLSNRFRRSKGRRRVSFLNRRLKERRSLVRRLCSAVWRPPFLGIPVRILGADCKRDSAARGELRGHDCLARRTGFHEIVKNAVCDGFIECALITVRREIEFQ